MLRVSSSKLWSWPKALFFAGFLFLPGPAVSLAQTVSSINLIPNFGFTAGITPWKLDYGSSLVMPDPLQPTQNILRVTGAIWASVYTDVSASVTPGASYTLSALGRVSGAKVGGYISLAMYDANWKSLPGKTVNVTSEGFAAYQMQFTIPANAKHIWISAIKNSASANDYADFNDFVLYLKPPLLRELGQRNNLGCYSEGDPGIVNGVQFAKWLGRQTNFAMDYVWDYTWSSMVTTAFEEPNCWHQAGYTKFMFAVAMIPADGVSTLAAGAAGGYDTYYQQMAANIIKAGYPDAIIRLGWEFNGNWYPWAAAKDPVSFVALWQRIVTLMRAVPGANFTFDWCYSMGAGGDLTAVYPGDAYADYIGSDFYDVWWNTVPPAATRWQTWTNMNFGLQWQANFAAAHNKRISFPEWGLGMGSSGSLGDDPAFINNMANWIATHDVAYSDIWNENGDELDIPATLVPNSSAAFKTDFGPAAYPQ